MNKIQIKEEIIRKVKSESNTEERERQYCYHGEEISVLNFI